MNDERSHARAWLAKAESDRLAAHRLLEAGGPFDAVCFHAQQACEKELKAVLASAGTEIPRTHNLDLERDMEYFVEPEEALGPRGETVE